ncbi:MAG: hypothetical protein MI746_12215 [Pseudomonadales bacterium]|nr:hypothetical protein [Pseudomonadales bacterium]
MTQPSDSDTDDSERFITPRISSKQRTQAKALLRARTRLIVCFWTLPVYVVAVWVLLNNQRDIDTIMFIYMGMWAGFAVDMVRRPCPSCHRQFFVKSILMNLRTRSCVHCGFDSERARQPAGNDEVTF